MANPDCFPCATRLDILYQPLEIADEKELAEACTHKWYKQTLCQVNGLGDSAWCCGGRVSLA